VVHDPNGTPQKNRTPNSKQPRTQDPGPPPQAKSLPRTRRIAAEKEAADVLRIRPAVKDWCTSASRPRHRRLPSASASLYEPANGRTWWWLSIRCPHCGSVHLGRVRSQAEAPGPRRAGCGRMVVVIVRRTYRSHASRQVAA
jgi:hypothetical protein